MGKPLPAWVTDGLAQIINGGANLQVESSSADNVQKIWGTLVSPLAFAIPVRLGNAVSCSVHT